MTTGELVAVIVWGIVIFACSCRWFYSLGYEVGRRDEADES